MCVCITRNLNFWRHVTETAAIFWPNETAAQGIIGIEPQLTDKRSVRLRQQEFINEQWMNLSFVKIGCCTGSTNEAVSTDSN
jgi:hypothetical protein